MTLEEYNARHDAAMAAWGASIRARRRERRRSLAALLVVAVVIGAIAALAHT